MSIDRNDQDAIAVTHMSKLSFQYGFRVFLMTLVVCVCSASTVITAKGSGNLKTSRLDRPSAATTANSTSVFAAVHLYSECAYL